MKKYIGILAAAMALATTSCNTDSDSDSSELVYTYQFELSSADFSPTGKWLYAEDTQIQNLGFEPFLQLSHKINNDNGLYWDGFLPVNGTETKDFTPDWSDHLWSSAAGCGAITSSNYMLAKWDPSEETLAVPTLPVLTLGNAVGGATRSFYVCNSNYVYHVMTSAEFNLQDSDYLRLIVKSVDTKGALNGVYTVTLAENGKVNKDWQMVTTDFELGSGIYFQMEASRNFGTGVGEIPPYFCLDNYSVFYKY